MPIAFNTQSRYNLYGPLLLFCILITNSFAQTCDPIDPVELFVVSGQTSNDHLGSSVAISDEFAVIGSPNRTDGSQPIAGGVDVYHKINGQWEFQTALTTSLPDTPIFAASFGQSVAISGDVIVVGADLDTNDSSIRTGAAYIFRFNAQTSSWDFDQKLTPPSGELFDRFGFSVSISGDVIVVGSPGDRVDTEIPDGSIASGSAYVYSRSGNAWELDSQLLASDGADFYDFGHSVSISNDTIAVTAPMASGVNHSGAVYVFEPDQTNGWSETALLTSTGIDFLGTSVSIDRDTLAVGASYYDGAAGDDQGAVVVYERDGCIWDSGTLLVSQIAGVSNYFGASVAVSNRIIIAGSPFTGPNGMAAGSAYVFQYDDDSSAWIQSPDATDSAGSANDYFGCAVALYEGTAIVGAWGKDTGDGSAFDSGAAYIYALDGVRWPLDLRVTSTTNPTVINERFGTSVAIYGDIAFIGAPRRFEIGDDQGSVNIYRFGKAGWAHEKRLEFSGNTADGFGFDVDIYGSTAVTSTPGSNSQKGKVHISEYNAKTQDWTTTIQLTAKDRGDDDLFGHAVAIFGDTIVIGARGDANPTTHSGSVYIFNKIEDEWIQNSILHRPELLANSNFGFTVDISASFIVVGSILGESAYVYNLDGTFSVQLKHDSNDSVIRGFGNHVSIDGNRILVGASKENSNTGAAYIFEHDGSTWNQTARLHGSHTGQAFGSSVDVSGDRIAIGSNVDAPSGSVTVFEFDGIQWNEDLIIRNPSTTDQNDTRFGDAVAISGDVLLIGAQQEDVNGLENEGAAYFHQRLDCTLPVIPDPPAPCPADMDGNGLLNFFDVSAFLVAFGLQDCSADFFEDGILNFTDVSIFLTSFGTGCP